MGLSPSVQPQVWNGATRVFKGRSEGPVEAGWLQTQAWYQYGQRGNEAEWFQYEVT